MTANNGRLAYSVTEAAGLLGLSRSSVYRAIERGEFPGVRRIGGRVIVSARALETWLELDADEREVLGHLSRQH